MHKFLIPGLRVQARRLMWGRGHGASLRSSDRALPVTCRDFGEPPRRRECTGPRGLGAQRNLPKLSDRIEQLAMADTSRLSPYITKVLEVVGGSPLFCQVWNRPARKFWSRSGLEAEKSLFWRPYRGAKSTFFATWVAFVSK